MSVRFLVALKSYQKSIKKCLNFLNKQSFLTQGSLVKLRTILKRPSMRLLSLRRKMRQNQRRRRPTPRRKLQRLKTRLHLLYQGRLFIAHSCEISWGLSVMNSVCSIWMSSIRSKEGLIAILAGQSLNLLPLSRQYFYLRTSKCLSHLWRTRTRYLETNCSKILSHQFQKERKERKRSDLNILSKSITFNLF